MRSPSGLSWVISLRWISARKVVARGNLVRPCQRKLGEYWKAVEAETDESNTVQPRSKRASVASSSSSQSRGGDTDNSAADSGSPDRQRKRKAGEPAEDPMEDMSDVETLQMVNEFNADLTSDRPNSGAGEAQLHYIDGHQWNSGQLKLRVFWDTEESSWEDFVDLRDDHPRMLAQYIVDRNVSRGNNKRCPKLAWAKNTCRDLKRAVRRVTRLYDFHLDEHEHVYKVRRRFKGSQKKKGKKRRKDYSKPVLKSLGIQIMHTNWMRATRTLSGMQLALRLGPWTR